MKISIIGPKDCPSSKTVIVVDMYTFSTTVAILLQLQPKGLFCMGGSFNDAKDAISTLFDAENSILIDDAVAVPDVEKRWFNGNVLPIYYNPNYFGVPISTSTILYRSSNGSQVVSQLVQEHQVLIGSLTNLLALVQWVRLKNISHVSLVVAGSKGISTVDDHYCSEYMKYVFEQGEHDKCRYIDFMRKIVLEGTDDSKDFFERYIYSSYGPLLGFNMACDISTVVPLVTMSSSQIFSITNIDL